MIALTIGNVGIHIALLKKPMTRYGMERANQVRDLDDSGFSFRPKGGRM